MLPFHEEGVKYPTLCGIEKEIGAVKQSHLYRVVLNSQVLKFNVICGVDCNADIQMWT